MKSTIASLIVGVAYVAVALQYFISAKDVFSVLDRDTFQVITASLYVLLAAFTLFEALRRR